MSDEAFLRWWNQLPQADRDTFANLEGDEDLARFVCAYDYLSVTQGEEPHTLVKAWSLASGKSERDHLTKVTAMRAWEHLAVRELLDRLASREAARAERRIERTTTLLIEETLQKAMASENLDHRSRSIMAAARWLHEGREAKNEHRKIRLAAEAEKLKQIITQKGEAHSDAAMTEADAAGFIRMLVDKFPNLAPKALMPATDDAEPSH